MSWSSPTQAFCDQFIEISKCNGATIFIITGKRPTQISKNKLKQSTFVKYLKQIIVDEYFKSCAGQKAFVDNSSGKNTERVNTETTICIADRGDQEHLRSSIQPALLTLSVSTNHPNTEPTDAPSPSLTETSNSNPESESILSSREEKSGVQSDMGNYVIGELVSVSLNPIPEDDSLIDLSSENVNKKNQLGMWNHATERYW